MGGRGSFNKISDNIPIENRQYRQIGFLNGIKIIEGITIKNGRPPVMSNSANTVYAVWSSTAGRIKHVLFYKNHVLYKAVDLEGGNSHWHSVRIDPITFVIGRVSHDSRNIHELSASQWKLVKMLEKWKRR